MFFSDLQIFYTYTTSEDRDRGTKRREKAQTRRDCGEMDRENLRREFQKVDLDDTDEPGEDVCDREPDKHEKMF
jgi:hypothetical protein